VVILQVTSGPERRIIPELGAHPQMLRARSIFHSEIPSSLIIFDERLSCHETNGWIPSHGYSIDDLT